MKKIVFIAVLLLGAAYGTWQLSRARTFQLFGELVPRVETDRKVVALTFDDGPRADSVDALLATLGGTKATFFVCGAELHDQPGVAEKLVAAGNELGNHSWSHRRMVFKSPSFIRSEFERTDALIRAAGYRGPIYVRAPYCKKLVGLPWYFAKTNRVHITWDVEPKPGDFVSYTVRHVRPGSIVLMHPWYADANEVRAALPAIISGLRDKGYQFLTVDELLKLRKS